MSFIDVPVAHGRLEAIFWKAETPQGAVVVCHPHPAQGGTMHNHVTYRIAKAFRDRNISTLRFNFRGVGRSSGTYDEGRGELEDARAALAFLAKEVAGVPLYCAGFSFGSRIALKLTVEAKEVRGVLAAGMAIDLFDFEFVVSLDRPKAFIHSERDEYGDLAKVNALVDRTRPPKRLFVVPDADHLCTHRLEALEQTAAAAVEWLLSVAAPSSG
jgi:alpha/beta superfamily hydrolase